MTTSAYGGNSMRIYRQPEWIRRARENKLPVKVSGGKAR